MLGRRLYTPVLLRKLGANVAKRAPRLPSEVNGTLYGCKKFGGVLHYLAIFRLRRANGKVPIYQMYVTGVEVILNRLQTQKTLERK